MSLRVGLLVSLIKTRMQSEGIWEWAAEENILI
jgi:hypothetical protein